MFTKNDILELSKEAYSKFSEKYSINCKIRVVNADVFWKYAKKSKLVQIKMEEKIPISIGALVVHSKIDIVYISRDVINSITDDPNFLKAIIMHEFYHVYFKQFLNYNTLESASESEFKAKQKMKKDFPKLSKYLVG